MLEKKKMLAEKLLRKGILLIYIDRSSTVFVAVDDMSSDEVAKLIGEEGFELTEAPEAGFFATEQENKNGFWCNLK